MTLNDLQPGQSAIIKSINADFEVCERLAALGVKPKNTVTVIRRLHAIQVRVNNTDLIIRSNDAELINIQKEFRK